MRIGERVREERKKHGLTLENLAVKTGRTAGAIGHWETGRNSPPFDDLVAICDAIGISLAELLNIETPTTADEQVLIECYRKMTPKAKQALMAYAFSVTNTDTPKP